MNHMSTFSHQFKWETLKNIMHQHLYHTEQVDIQVTNDITTLFCLYVGLHLLFSF